MNVENYDYKTEGLKEQHNTLEPRNTLVDFQTQKEGQSISNYLQGLDQKIQALEQGLQMNNGVDRQQQEALNALNEKNTVKTKLISRIENCINENPQLQEPLKYAFIPEGDARLRNLNRNPESAKQVKLETGTVAVA